MNTQKPILVIVIPNKYFDFYKNKVEKLWPLHSVYFLLNYSGRGVVYGFDYPTDIDSLTFPFIKELSWKKCNEDTGYVWHLENKEINKTNYTNSAILKAAEKIVLMCAGICVSEPIAFQVLLEQNFGKNIDQSYLLYVAENLGSEEVEFSLKNPITTNASVFQEQLKMDTAKRYFEYNFNFNSCVLFKPVLQKAGVLDKHFVFTKFVLALFYLLRDKSNFSTYEIVEIVYNWKGSGSYPETSSSYTCTILENLSKAELIKDNGNGTEDNEHYDLTEKGKKLFELIHPDCWDIDIPGKLVLWEENWPESKKEMDEYLITFFKKQMEFVP